MRRLGLGIAGAAAVAVAYDDDVRRSFAISTVGTVARVFIRNTNRLTMHDSHHLDAALARPPGTALLSVSNHIATVDDPHLLSAIVPYSVLLRGGSSMRWGVCASDVCFRPGSWLNKFADSAKVLPIERHGGVWQPELDAVIGKLRKGEWVHYFPEGKIRQDGRIHPFRRGVGRLVAGVENSDSLQVVPFYHTGCDKLQPTTPTSKVLFTWPNFGTDVHVIFGAPVDLSRLLALRSTPPFDRRPELLFEVIAHTLEEEVRGLRAELHRRLDWPLAFPPEAGAFVDQDRPQIWRPDLDSGSDKASAASSRPS